MKIKQSTKARFYRFVMIPACLAVCLAGFGCASVPSEAAIKEDALNEFQKSPIRPPVVLTENTHASLQKLAHMNHLANAWNFGGGADDVRPQIITDGIRQSISALFPQYGAAPPDGLVVIFDAQAHLGGHSFAKTTLQLSGVFKDGNRVIDTVTGSGSAKIPYPATNCGFSRAARDAFAEFNENLRAAPGLIAYLSSKKPIGNSAVVSNPTPTGNPTAPQPNNSASAAPASAEPPQNPVGQTERDAPPNPVAPSTPPPTAQEGNSVYNLLPSTPPANPPPEDNR